MQCNLVYFIQFTISRNLYESCAMIYESFSEAQQLTVVESAHTRVNIYNSLATGITEMTFASADESKLQ